MYCQDGSVKWLRRNGSPIIRTEVSQREDLKFWELVRENRSGLRKLKRKWMIWGLRSLMTVQENRAKVGSACCKCVKIKRINLLPTAPQDSAASWKDTKIWDVRTCAYLTAAMHGRSSRNMGMRKTSAPETAQFMAWRYKVLGKPDKINSLQQNLQYLVPTFQMCRWRKNLAFSTSY